MKFVRVTAVVIAALAASPLSAAEGPAWSGWGDVDSLETLLGFEEMTYFAAFMWLAIAGPGAASVDRLLVNAAGHAEEST